MFLSFFDTMVRGMLRPYVIMDFRRLFFGAKLRLKGLMCYKVIPKIRSCASLRSAELLDECNGCWYFFFFDVVVLVVLVVDIVLDGLLLMLFAVCCIGGKKRNANFDLRTHNMGKLTTDFMKRVSRIQDN